MKKIFTKDAPQVVGPYSQAIENNGLLFCSGQIGLVPETGEFAGDEITAQTEQVIKNLSAVLEEAGSSLKKVLKTTCFLKNMSDYQKFNDVYAKHFTENPARATVAVAALPKNALVEIELIATI